MKLRGPSGRIRQHAQELGITRRVTQHAVGGRITGVGEVHPLQRGPGVDSELRLDETGFLKGEHVEESVGIELVEEVDERHGHRWSVRHAQTRDGLHPIGRPDGGVPGNRRTPVVAQQDDRPVVERRRHRSHVARQLAQGVPLDLGRG